MAVTTQSPDIHTQAGARWLAPFVLAVLVTLFVTMLMIVYPYVSS